MRASADGRRRVVLQEQRGGIPAWGAELCGQDIAFVTGDAISQTESRAVNIWLMGPNGGNLRQVTHGSNDQTPVCTPDGRWMIYVDLANGLTLMKLDLRSGETHPLAPGYSIRYNSLGLSRDGALLAVTGVTRERQNELAIVDVASERIVKSWPLEHADAGCAQFTPDGTGIAFVARASGDSTILLQPVDGGARRTLASWPQQDVEDFQWSADGRHFAIARGRTTSDVVLVRQGQ